MDCEVFSILRFLLVENMGPWIQMDTNQETAAVLKKLPTTRLGIFRAILSREIKQFPL